MAAAPRKPRPSPPTSGALTAPISPAAGQRLQPSFGKGALLIDVGGVGADGLGANLF